MSTVVKDLRELILSFAENRKGKDNLRVKKAFLDVICAIDDFELVEKEKKQIIDACYSGKLMQCREGDITPIQYYDKLSIQNQ